MRKQKIITRIIVCVLVLLYGLQVLYAKQSEEEHVLILGYHHIVPDEDKEQYFKNSMWVNSLSSFEAQMNMLYEQGYQSLTLDELHAWIERKTSIHKKSVVITFDDGFYSSSKFAQPVLKKYGFKGTVFVIGSLIDNDHGVYDPSKRQHASLEDMKDTSTMSYYAHSYNLHHKKNNTFKVNTQTKQQLQKDLEKEQQLVSTTYYAYPYGKYNDTMIDVLKEQGVKLAFGYNENRKAKRTDSSYALPRFNINAYTKLDVFQTMLESR